MLHNKKCYKKILKKDGKKVFKERRLEEWRRKALAPDISTQNSAKMAFSSQDGWIIEAVVQS